MRVPSFHAFRAGRASAVVLNPTPKLWSWGINTSGQLGLGNTTNRSSPVQVGALTDWAEVFGGTNRSFAIKTDGTLWSWGNNTLGALGQGNQTSRSSPVQVGALTDWAEAKISNRLFSTLAVKSNGTLWAWGGNGYGELGLGNTTNRSSPVQVGALTNWSKVFAISVAGLATKTDGTLWAWGRNYTGQLGQGNNTDRSSPVQIGALTTWSKIAGAGSLYRGYGWTYTHGFFSAIKTDGTLWSWGSNGYGQLGVGNNINRSSPVQVGALTDWSKLSINGDMMYANGNTTAVIKTNGTLWAWGSNGSGAFANGITSPTRRSTPIQVLSGISDWTSVSVIGSVGTLNTAMLAIRTT